MAPVSKFTHKPVPLKSYVQQLLEDAHGKDIREIVRDTFEKHRGRARMPMFVGAELGISAPTLTKWCRVLGIDIHVYGAHA